MATNLAQVLLFNVFETKQICDGFLIQSKSNKSSLPVNTGLLVLAKTRQKLLFGKLLAEGLRISSKKVQNIQKLVSNQLCYKLLKHRILCPPSLLKELFLNTAIDNIDNHPSSTVAKLSFHGTGISSASKVRSYCSRSLRTGRRC